jgi:hypothetical protein
MTNKDFLIFKDRYSIVLFVVVLFKIQNNVMDVVIYIVVHVFKIGLKKISILLIY